MSEELKVAVPVLRRDVASFTIIGTRPLLCSKKPLIAIGVKIPAPKSDNEAFVRALYKFDKEGVANYGFPAMAIKQAMISACAHCSAVKAHTRGRVFVETDDDSEEYIALLHPNLEPKKFNTVVGKGLGSSVPATYARFNLWALKFDITYFVEMIPREDLDTLLVIAGEAVGLGARRVETGDNRIFGTFRLAQPAEIKEIETKWTSVATV